MTITVYDKTVWDFTTYQVPPNLRRYLEETLAFHEFELKIIMDESCTYMRSIGLRSIYNIPNDLVIIVAARYSTSSGQLNN